MDIDVVDQRLELRGFYERFGYERISEMPFTKPGAAVPVSMIQMRKPLVTGYWDW
jgi:hypothetical protein